MAYCTNCGSPIEEGAKFCTNCGTRVAAAPAQPVFRQPVEPQIVYQTPAPAKRKKHILPLFVGSIVGVLVILIAIIALAGGDDSFTEAGTGTYHAATAEALGISVDIDTVYPDGFSIVLKDGGKCTVTVGKDSASGKWSTDGDIVHISASDVEITGTLTDSSIIVDNLMDAGFTIIFRKEGAAAPDVPAHAPEVTPTEETADSLTFDTEWWDGQWYGWWTATDSTGSYVEWKGNWWDCCADIESYSDDFLYMCLWDEDYSRQEPIAEMNFVLDEGSAEMGIAKATEGYFFDMELTYGCFTIDPSIYNLENLIALEGDYANDEGTIHFRMYLRPWGQDWSDVELDEYEEIPYTPEDMYPYYYEDWYLPAIQSGLSMPDTIGNEES